jgi:hypothetical protein
MHQPDFHEGGQVEAVGQEQTAYRGRAAGCGDGGLVGRLDESDSPSDRRSAANAHGDGSVWRVTDRAVGANNNIPSTP